MQFLHKQIKDFNTFAATNELKKLAPTIRGRIEQANKWFLNPYNGNSLSGIEAAKFIIGECQRLALRQFKETILTKLAWPESRGSFVYSSTSLLCKAVFYWRHIS